MNPRRARAGLSLLLGALLLCGRALANTIVGQDCGGANLICDGVTVGCGGVTCGNNDALQGIFTNVGLFSIGAGTSVFVSPNVALAIFSSTISLTGGSITLNGSGRGSVGGIGGDPGSPGGNGQGTGPGNGGAAQKGGGGGAYGGNGGIGAGQNGAQGSGGTSYDPTPLPISIASIAQGSGGGGGGGGAGQTSGTGGQGGASIYLEASSMTITSTITVRGLPGGIAVNPAGSGGGGAGGGILLRCPGALTLSGYLYAAGGNGGDATTPNSFATVVDPGGGGGGGRVKIFYNTAGLSSVSISTAGGPRGQLLSGFSSDDTPAPTAGSAGTVTFGVVASSPANMGFSQVNVTSITWSWTATPNWGDAAVASRSYQIYSNTTSYRSSSRGAQLSVSSSTTQGTETGLAPNTAYARYVTAFTNDSDSLPSNTTSAFTLAAIPASPSFSNISTSAFQANWNANGNPAGTQYVAQVSTISNFAPLYLASTTLNAFATFNSTLPANTTYYFQVQAVNASNVATPFTGAISTTTLADVPFNSRFNPVFVSSLTLSWASNDSTGTTYVADLSADGFQSVLVSSVTLSLSASFAGLTANTTYYARVKAVNFNNLSSAYAATISTITLAAQPGAASPPFSGITANGLTFAWTGGGNPAGTNYGAELSSTNFSTLFSSLTTTNLNAAFSSLSPNTTYYARVRALGFGGLAGAYSTPVVSTAVLAEVPAGLGFSNVTLSSFTLSWLQGNNPSGTLFIAEVSADGFATVTSSMTTGLSAGFTGLAGNTTYAARVKARNWNGQDSAYSASISTVTGVVQPGNAAPPFANVDAADLTFNWTSGGNSAGTNYEADLSTNNFATLLSSAATTNLNNTFTGLSANTTYYARVRAFNGAAASPFSSPVVSTVTLTVAPALTSPPFSNVNTSSFTLSWSPNGNPANTTYVAELSQDGFVTIATSSQTLNTNATFTALNVNASYDARVKAVNFNNVAGPYSTTGSTATLALAPANIASPFSALASDGFTLTWSANGNPGGTTYGAEISSTNFATLTSSAATLALSQAFSGLAANTTYYARVRALNLNNIPTAYTSTVSVVTLALAPVPAVPPFSNVNISSLSFSWTSGANPANTTYIVQVSANGFASVISSQTLSLSALFTSLSPNTTYQARVQALNFSGVGGPFSSPIASTSTLAVPPVAASPAMTAVSSTSMSAQWSANGNPAGTLYAVDITTDSSFTFILASQQTSNLSRTFAGLAPNTTHYAQVRALNNNNLPTANVSLGAEVSYAAAPAVAASTTTGYVSVTTFSFANTVSTGPGGIAYYRYAFDSNAPPHSFTDTESSWTALSPLNTAANCNGSWYLHLKSYNSKNAGNATGDAGPFIVSVNTPSPPGKPASNTGAFASSQLNWSWSQSSECGSANGLSYLVSLGTSPGQFNVLVDSNVGNVLNFSYSGPQQGLTYYLRVRSTDSVNVYSAFSPASDGVTVDLTQPIKPGVPQAPAYSYTPNVAFAWTPSSASISGIQGYIFQVGTTPNGSDVFNQNIGNVVSYTVNSLASNRVYYAQVQAVNNAGVKSAFSDVGGPFSVWVPSSAAPIDKPYNWPNPFNPNQAPTNIGFFLAAPANVVMKFFTLEGNKVYETSSYFSSGGNQVMTWNGRNGTGRTVEPGGYVVIVEKHYADSTETQRMKLAVLY